ncbi:MAG: response regulator, partial [Defluviitaleaceae bacterium]|nr:response regulator [Defluviitaleaceae bacterium]
KNDRKNIFLVDDSITSLAMGESILSKFYNVFTLNSGKLLFEVLEKTMPDLILLDIEMPEMNGYEVIKKLKEDKKTQPIPVIFLTGIRHKENEYKGLALGAIDYVTKPFSPALLKQRIDLHLLLVSQKHHLLEYSDNFENLVQERLKDIVQLKQVILASLAELIEYRDEVTGSHIERTKRFLSILFEGMKKHGIYRSEMFVLDEELALQSCQLHDIGKISIKDSILFKPGELTEEEYDEIKKHTTIGGNIIASIMKKTSDSKFLEYAKIFAETHHEWWNGKGYPNGLEGEKIPLLGRLMAIVDTYDALRSERPYKEAFSHEKSKAIILKLKGTQFDPVLVDLFEKTHEEFEKTSTVFS